jgi:hypothetical protein
LTNNGEPTVRAITMEAVEATIIEFPLSTGQNHGQMNRLKR